MRVIERGVVKDKKEYCCGSDVVTSDKYKNNKFICGDLFDKDHIVLCNKCYPRLLNGNN